MDRSEYVMRTVNFTEFRSRASDLLSAVERGESLLVLRHGRPIAEVSPAVALQPSWKSPALRLSARGAGLAAAILEEREHETVP
jgi:prevent-host-death family protein